MKIKKNRIYPFPIYSTLTDDYKDNNFGAEIELDYDSEIADLSIKPVISDSKIKDLIENNIVGLFCHVECSSTKYRELFEIVLEPEKDTYVIPIPLYKLNDNIEIMCALVAKESITGFTDDNLNEFFEGESIAFPMYATIGYTDTTEINITKRIDVNGDVPSIFSICKDETGDCVSYNLDGDQIIVYLPAEQYDIYENYKGSGVRIKQMMLNIPVLNDVINAIKKEPEAFEDRPWYTVLEESFKKKGFDDGFGDVKFESKDAMILSQMLLGNISKDAFNEFDKMNGER